MSLSLLDRQSPVSFIHILLCFSPSEDLRGELEKEEKGKMVVVIVSAPYVAMERIHFLPVTVSLGFVHGWFFCLLTSVTLPSAPLSLSSSPHSADSLRPQWDL